MIRFRNAMGYYDIHTHQMPFHKEDIAIINRIVSPMGDMQPGSLPDTVIRSYGIHPWYIYNVKEQIDLLSVGNDPDDFYHGSGFLRDSRE